jgi:hypothetical protein
MNVAATFNGSKGVPVVFRWFTLVLQWRYGGVTVPAMGLEA